MERTRCRCEVQEVQVRSIRGASGAKCDVWVRSPVM